MYACAVFIFSDEGQMGGDWIKGGRREVSFGERIFLFPLK